MKYFLFVSDAKVDMLLPQIPQESKSKLAAEIGVNVGVLSAKLKSEQDTGVKPDSISRLNAVSNFLRNTQNIGTVDEPEAWVEGTQDVRIVYPTSSRQAVFFVGRSETQTRFALAGSSAHLISRKTSTDDIGWSFLPDLMIQLRAIFHTFEDSSITEELADLSMSTVTSGYEFEWIDHVGALEERATGPSMKVSFLAKRLLAGKHERLGFNAVLATPLYVAMEE